jgi:hypothetical protein
LGIVAFIASHGVLTIGLGPLIRPAAAVSAAAFLAHAGNEAASLRFTIPPLVDVPPRRAAHDGECALPFVVGLKPFIVR